MAEPEGGQQRVGGGGRDQGGGSPHGDGGHDGGRMGLGTQHLPPLSSRRQQRTRPRRRRAQHGAGASALPRRRPRRRCAKLRCPAQSVVAVRRGCAPRGAGAGRGRGKRFSRAAWPDRSAWRGDSGAPGRGCGARPDRRPGALGRARMQRWRRRRDLPRSMARSRRPLKRPDCCGAARCRDSRRPGPPNRGQGHPSTGTACP